MVHSVTAGYALTLLQPAQATHSTEVLIPLQTGLRNQEQWELQALAASAAAEDNEIIHIYTPYTLV